MNIIAVTKPILIFVERHWDHIPKQVLITALSTLAKHGYQTLCFENPANDSEDLMIEGIKSTITRIESILSQAEAQLARHKKQTSDLCKMEYQSLSRLLELYVSSKHYNEIALQFRELPGHKEKLALVETAKAQHFTVAGIDLNAEELSPIRSEQAQFDLHFKTKMLNALENKRVNAFVENLLNYQEQGRGVISIIGQSHYQNLVKKFEENQALLEVKFFHIFTPDILANACADMYIGLEDNQLTTYVDRAIRNEQDMLRFLTEFKDILEEISENSYQKLPTATASTECLNRLSSLHFDSYCRPSFFVDCLSRIDTAEDLASAQTILTKGIKGNLTFFDQQLHFCVPNVNKSDVAQHLQKLTK